MSSGSGLESSLALGFSKRKCFCAYSPAANARCLIFPQQHFHKIEDEIVETNTVVTTVGNVTRPMRKKLIDRYRSVANWILFEDLFSLNDSVSE